MSRIATTSPGTGSKRASIQPSSSRRRLRSLAARARSAADPASRTWAGLSRSSSLSMRPACSRIRSDPLTWDATREHIEFAQEKGHFLFPVIAANANFDVNTDATATDRSNETIVIDAAMVHERVAELAKNADLSKFIL